MNKRGMEIIAKLRTMIAISEAEVAANPMPYLREAHSSLIEARICFEELERALSPDVVWEEADNMGVKPIDFIGGDRVKINKASEVLRKYYSGELNPAAPSAGGGE